MIEFLTSFAFELPWVFTTKPFKPNNGAPPYWLASNAFNVVFKAGLTKSAPILLLSVAIIPCFTMWISVAPTPS